MLLTLDIQESIEEFNEIVLFLTNNSQKYSEWNLASEKMGGLFPSKYEILSFEKCFNY